MNTKISVIIPAFNEEKHIEKVIKKAQKCELVNEVIVVDNLSTDNTKQVTINTGASVIECANQGKGYAMEEGLKYAKNDIVVFLDADIPSYSDDIVDILTKPIISNNIDFVKSTFDREGGRVTQLVAKPLLKILYPELEHFSQPLSGMIAGKKEILEKLVFEKDYGVDIGILIDVLNIKATMEEVNIGKIENDSKEWKQLDSMSTEVMKAILKRRNII